MRIYWFQSWWWGIKWLPIRTFLINLLGGNITSLLKEKPDLKSQVKQVICPICKTKILWQNRKSK